MEADSMRKRKTPQISPLSVRLTNEEKEALTEAAKVEGMNRNAYVRQVLNIALTEKRRTA